MSLLFENLSSFGKALALVDLASGESITYANLRDVLRRHEPADAGKPTLVGGAPDFGNALRLLAVLAAGRVVVPLSPRLPAAEVRHRGARIAGSGSASTGAGTILFTSGSSGVPKAVFHNLEAHESNARAARERMPLGPGCGWLLSLPLHHVSGLAVLVRCLSSGATVVFPDKSRLLGEALHSEHVTHISVVEVQLRRLLEGGAELSSLKAVLGGGGPFSAALIDAALSSGVPLHLTYGMTEGASQIATTTRMESLPEPVHAGQPLPGCEVEISPDREILVKTPAMAFRILRGEAEWGSPVDGRGFYHTGDLGAFTPGGELVIVGRRDRMLVSGGENIHPEAIEILLGGIPGVRRAAVVAVAHREFGQRPVAFIDGAVEEAELHDRLAGQLERFVIPDRFLRWPESVPSDAAKIDYPMLAMMAEEALGGR